MISQRWSLAVAMAFVALVLFALVALWWRARRRRSIGAVLCPGPSPRWFNHLAPWRLIYLPMCGYDLSGLPRTNDQSCACPECGTRVSPRRARTSARHWRTTPTTLLLCGALLAVWFSPWVKQGRYAKSVPTGVLIWAKHQLHASLPPVFDREIVRRTTSGLLSPSQKLRLADAVIYDLADDDVKWNASAASDLLSALGPAALPALERALDAPDHQMRNLAARELRWWRGYTVTSRLIEVSVEALREHSGYVGESMRWLAECHAPVFTYLERGIASADWQQRLLCAMVAGMLHENGLFDRASPILISALQDNDTSEDAKLAVRGLVGFDPTLVIAALQPLVDAPDHQQRTLARALLARLSAPEQVRTIVDEHAAWVSSIDPAAMDVWSLRVPDRYGPDEQAVNSPCTDDSAPHAP